MYQYRVDTGNFQVSSIHEDSALLTFFYEVPGFVMLSTVLVLASKWLFKKEYSSGEEDLGGSKHIGWGEGSFGRVLATQA